VIRDDYTDKIFSTRAVAPDVAADRGYRRYGKGDHATVIQVDPKLDDPELAGWLRAALRDSGGWVLPKWEVMSDHPVFGETPYAQLRPDRPAMAKPTAHDHDGMLHHHRDDLKLQRRRGKNRGRCYCGLTHDDPRPPFKRVLQWPGGTGEHALLPGQPPKVERSWHQRPLPRRSRREHEASLCEWATVPDGSWMDGLVVRKDRQKLVRDDGKKLVPTGHLHPDTGEIVVPIKGPHVHLEWAKYLYVKGGDRAKRLSTHPSVRETEYAAPEGLFFFVIEGTLKLDAVVSAGWPGIESGSVTLWNVYGEDNIDGYAYGTFRGYQELQSFASRYLEGIPTAVVCDSDWADNWMVREQVDRAVTLLEGCGVPAVGCAPPPGADLRWRHPVTDWPMHQKQGVDDFLAIFRPEDRHDALLDGLVVREPAVDDAPGLEAAARDAAGNSRGVETHRRLLRELGRRATDSGVVPWRRKALAYAIRRSEGALSAMWGDA
jgi:hypothetical protein